MARLKKISEEERAARAQLRGMGVSEYELDRLYDANYKARQRAIEQSANPGKTLNLSWAQVLRNARQAIAEGRAESASDYIQSRRQTLSDAYRTKTVKEETLKRLAVKGYDPETGEIKDSGSWAEELLLEKANDLTGSQVAALEAEQMKEAEQAGEIPGNIVYDSYRDAKRKYIETNASTKEEWDNLLKNEFMARDEAREIVQQRVAEQLEIDFDKIQQMQDEAEAQAQAMFNLSDPKEAEEAARYLEREKQKAFSMFGG